jgi:hypothetical protein
LNAVSFCQLADQCLIRAGEKPIAGDAPANQENGGSRLALESAGHQD